MRYRRATVHLRNLDERGKELLAVGVAGVIGACFCLYALLFPAIAVLYLTDGYHFPDFASKAVGGAAILAVTGVIAGGLVVAGAAIRMTAIGRWPGRPFIFGPPGAAIIAFAFAFAAMLGLLL